MCSLSSYLGKHQALQPPCLQGDRGDGMPASATGSQDTQLKEVLRVAWRVAATETVALLALCCREARKLHLRYKNNKQVVGELTMPLHLHRCRLVCCLPSRYLAISWNTCNY